VYFNVKVFLAFSVAGLIGSQWGEKQRCAAALSRGATLELNR
jgi:hypothetical protein